LGGRMPRLVRYVLPIIIDGAINWLGETCCNGFDLRKRTRDQL
jgi:hypothetical protein